MYLESFINRTEEYLDKPELKKAVTKATDTTVEKRNYLLENESNLEVLKEYLSDVKKHIIDNLEHYLAKAKMVLEEKKINLFYADNGNQACEYIGNILEKSNSKLVVKAKSMVSEEIHLNKHLEKLGIEVLETDLGEYIVQIANETPSHITAPALHKSKKDIAKLFHEKFGIEYTEKAEELTAFARKILREKFLNADAGISGANFLAAEEGTFVLVENEGNIRFSTSKPKTEIILIGIEKLIPSLKSIGIFLRLLSASATGQKFPTYVSFITPDNRELDNQKNINVIFIDNGRSTILNNPIFKDTLKCIRCGACMNVCPIYRRVSGHAYKAIYPGPIGSIISQFIFGDEYNDLAFGSTLCGRCSEVCPVKIDLHHLLLESRNFRNNTKKKLVENIGFKIFSYVSTKPKIYSIFSNFGRYTQKIFSLSRIVKGWNKERELPKLSTKRFRDYPKDKVK